MTAPKTKTLRLQYPVTVEGREVSSVTITRPKVKDLKAMDAALDGIKDKLDQGIIMVSVLTGLSHDTVEDLDAEDFTKLSEEVAGFFPQAKAPGNGAPLLPRLPIGSTPPSQPSTT
ncbi:MAG: phage tail assembly protein [Pelagibaca sp.]